MENKEFDIRCFFTRAGRSGNKATLVIKGSLLTIMMSDNRFGFSVFWKNVL